MEHVGNILNLRKTRPKKDSPGVLLIETTGTLEAQTDITRHQQQLIDAAAEIRERWPLTSDV
jgi:hypothetical protein